MEDLAFSIYVAMCSGVEGGRRGTEREGGEGRERWRKFGEGGIRRKKEREREREREREILHHITVDLTYVDNHWTRQSSHLVLRTLPPPGLIVGWWRVHSTSLILQVQCSYDRAVCISISVASSNSFKHT